MLRILSLAALFAILAGCSAQAAESWNIDAMNRRIDQTNFVVNTGCSGTLIDRDKRYILTANHCVGDQYETVDREEITDKGEVKTKKIRVLRPGTVRQIDFKGTAEVRVVTYTTSLKAYDKDHDLALLQIQAEKIPNREAAPIACREPVRGEAAYVVGNPMGVLYSSVVRGIVSSVQRSYQTIDFPNDEPTAGLMQISGGVIGGNSGGAVYNAHGELIGVPVLANRMNEVVGFAVPLSAIHAFLKQNGVDSDCPAGAE